MPDQYRRDYMERRKAQAKLERESFIPHYREISDNISPRRGRFLTSDRNKGHKRPQANINNVASQSSRIAQAGMFAGIMSPTRPWFELTSPDPELAKFGPVKEWYRAVGKQMRAIFNDGNLYQMAPVMLKELLDFGTGCMTHVDDDESLARFYAHTAGSYMLAQNDKFQVDTLIREFEMQVGQMAQEFGVENLSITVQGMVDRNELDSWVKVTHFIEPNDDFRYGNPMAKFKKFSSCKYETGNTDKDQMLSESGFEDFPAYCPRWATTGEDVYGTDCPGMATLGDTKGLQIQEKRKAQGIDKIVNPPLQGPASLRNVPVSSLPGGLNVFTADGGQKLESIYNVNLPIDHLSQDMERVERRIKESYFVDLFFAITNMQGIQPRNEQEIAERNGERLLQLGPVLERTQGEFLDLLISKTFNQMVKADILPPPPEEIAGQPLKVNYVSSLAQAQRAVDTSSIDRLTSYTSNLIQAGLSDGKKFDGDKAIEEYSDLLGTPTKLIRLDEDIEAERAQAAQQQQAAQAMQIAQAGGQAAAAASQVDLEKDTPVSRILDG